MKPKTSKMLKSMYENINPIWKKIPDIFACWLLVCNAYPTFPILNCRTDNVNPAFGTFHLTSVYLYSGDIIPLNHTWISVRNLQLILCLLYIKAVLLIIQSQGSAVRKKGGRD